MKEDSIFPLKFIGFLMGVSGSDIGLGLECHKISLFCGSTFSDIVLVQVSFRQPQFRDIQCESSLPFLEDTSSLQISAPLAVTIFLALFHDVPQVLNAGVVL